MAAKNEYPQNKGIRARQEAIYRGFSVCRSMLSNLKELGIVDQLQEPLRARVKAGIDEALEAAETASDAMCGEG